MRSEVGGEPVTQGVDHIEFVTGLQLCELAGAVADNLDEQRQSTFLLVDVMYRDGTAQHHLAASLHLHLDELTRYHGLHLATMTKHQREILAAQLMAFQDGEIVYFFHIL